MSCALAGRQAQQQAVFPCNSPSSPLLLLRRAPLHAGDGGRRRQLALQPLDGHLRLLLAVVFGAVDALAQGHSRAHVLHTSGVRACQESLARRWRQLCWLPSTAE